MSASDAAPLPRLGEVFFDVRGDSRSMRLSWYADTGVAVFSIWQGGRCTGTFRLPIDDLPRMIDILQRGPEKQPRLRAAGRRSGRAVPEPPPADGAPAGYGQAGYGQAGYGQAGYGQAGYGHADAGYGPADDGLTAGLEEAADGYETGAYRSEGREPGGRRTGRWPDGYPDDRQYADPSPDYEPRSGYGDPPAGYADSAGRGYAEPAGGRHDPAAPYESSPADYQGPARGYGDPAGYRAAGYWQEEQDGYLPPSPGQDGLADTQLASYGQDRFVPPYVRTQVEPQVNDNPPAAAGHRHAARPAAYPADRSGVSAEPDRYADSAWSGASYSGGSDYRPAADLPAGTRHSRGRHGDPLTSQAAPSGAADADPLASEDGYSGWDHRHHRAR